MMRGDLTGQFAADAAARPRHQDGFSFHIACHGIYIDCNGIPAQQIVQFHFPHIGYADLPV